MSRLVREKRSARNYDLFHQFKINGKVEAMGIGNSTISGSKLLSTLKLQIYKENQFEIIKFKLINNNNNDMYFRTVIKCDIGNGNINFNNFYERMIGSLELSDFKLETIK